MNNTKPPVTAQPQQAQQSQQVQQQQINGSPEKTKSKKTTEVEKKDSKNFEALVHSKKKRLIKESDQKQKPNDLMDVYAKARKTTKEEIKGEIKQKNVKSEDNETKFDSLIHQKEAHADEKRDVVQQTVSINPTTSVSEVQTLTTVTRSEAVSSTNAITTQKVEAIVNRISDEMSINTNRNEIKISLKPEILDGTQITIRRDGGVVNINFATSSLNAQALLQTNKNKLMEDLKKKSGTTSDVTVSVDGPQQVARAVLRFDPNEEAAL